MNIRIRESVDLVYSQKKYVLTTGAKMVGVAIGTFNELIVQRIYEITQDDTIEYLIVGDNQGQIDETIWSFLGHQLDLGHIKIVSK